MSTNSDLYIKKLWQGKVSLVETYWLWGVLVSIVLSLGVSMAPLVNQTFAVIVSLVAFLYAIFISVAIWKSASLFEGKLLWKYLAKIAVILPFILLAWSLILPKLSMKATYQSSSECILMELKANELQNIQLAILNISNYCNGKVIENLSAKLGLQSKINEMFKEGFEPSQISEALLRRVIQEKNYPKRENYLKQSECIYELTRNGLGSKQTEFILNNYVKQYCSEVVAINLSIKNDFDLHGALENKYSFKEIADFLELGKQ